MKKLTVATILAVAAAIALAAPMYSCWLTDAFPFHARFPACGAETSGYGGAQ